MIILGLCGSLRTHSSNGFILKAAQRALHTAEWRHFDLATLPYFDPDHQFSKDTPSAALNLRALATEADVIFISTPEYARGIPGILKNALEWMFYEGTAQKPVFVTIGAAEGETTKNQLLDVLQTMDFKIAPSHIFILKGARSKINSEGKLQDPQCAQDFQSFIGQISLLK